MIYPVGYSTTMRLLGQRGGVSHRGETFGSPLLEAAFLIMGYVGTQKSPGAK